MTDSRQQRAIERFLEEYPFVRKLAVRFAPARELADEIVNEVFIQFTNAAEQWDFESDIRPILIHLTRTTAVRQWKKSFRDAPESLRRIADKIQRHALERSDALEERFERLRECVERLPPRAKALVEQFYWKKVPLYRIAERMNAKASTIRQTMVRLRLKLRDCIDAFDEKEDENV